MKYPSLLLILILAGLAMACNQEDDANFPPVIDCEEENCILPPRNTAFGLAMLQKLQEAQPDENIFISPFSISNALSMTLNGAAGQTQSEMLAALAYDGLTPQTVNEEFKVLLESLPILDNEVDFLPANSIWYKQGFSVRPDFLDVNADYYQAEVSDLDFTDPASVGVINNWVADNTNDLIQSILQTIPANAVMYLVNAVYFKGNWQQSFDPEHTEEAPFLLADGSTENVEMMRYDGKIVLPYLATESFQAVDLAYGDSIFSMTVFLPKENTGLDELVDQLSLENWQDWTASLQPQEIYFAMPRFTLKYEKMLNDALIGLGMERAFSREADFSNINPDAPLQISAVRHKSFIEVNEVGTEAAAVTSVEIVFNTSVDPTPSVRLDRPFLFAIRENKTGSLLFLGKMMNPNAEE